MKEKISIWEAMEGGNLIHCFDKFSSRKELQRCLTFLLENLEPNLCLKVSVGDKIYTYMLKPGVRHELPEELAHPERALTNKDLWRIWHQLARNEDVPPFRAHGELRRRVEAEEERTIEGPGTVLDEKLEVHTLAPWDSFTGKCLTWDLGIYD